MIEGIVFFCGVKNYESIVIFDDFCPNCACISYGDFIMPNMLNFEPKESSYGAVRFRLSEDTELLLLLMINVLLKIQLGSTYLIFGMQKAQALFCRSLCFFGGFLAGYFLR